MLIQVSDNLFYGDIAECSASNVDKYSSVHACKNPCHTQAVGYSGTLPKEHPQYLFLENGHELFLNLIDPPIPLFKIESFKAFISFADREIGNRPLLIHCNEGYSRAPSLALLFAAKRLKLFPDDSYESAATAFKMKHPYRPNTGIQAALSKYWNEL